MKKKILILYATAGIGHKKAALAIKKAFDELSMQDIEVTIIDSLDYTNGFFKWTYLKVYLLMVNRLPLLWGILYYLTDNFYFNLLIARLRRLNNWLNSIRLARYLEQSKPRAIISTHFFATEVVSDLKKAGKLESCLITVVTDYRLHSWWVSDFVDMYIVGSNDAQDDLSRWGIPSSKIKILGIPVEPLFSKAQDKKNILRTMGLKEDAFTTLVIGGGFGVGPIEEIIKSMNNISRTIQIITICGHNEKLVERLENLKNTLGPTVIVKTLGFVDNVYDYMSISDALISKSGGITVAESLAKELPMIIISPILGQETRNSDFLVKHAAAIKIDKPYDLKSLLEDLISHPDRIERMKEAIRTIKKPMACYDIARFAADICNQNP